MREAKRDSKNSRVHVIAERCKGCRFCIEFCPKHALYQSTQTNTKGYYIVASEDTKCNGCGTCSMVCPEFAIYVDSTEEAA